MQRVLIPSARVLILLLEDLVEDLGDGEGAVAFEQLHGNQKALLPSGMSSERWQRHIGDQIRPWSAFMVPRSGHQNLN